MRNWASLVDERLAKLDLPPEVRREVVAEIAEHLEDCHAGLVEEGGADPGAQTLEQVVDWAAFRRNIRRAKEDPMSVARKVVMPGLAALIAGLAALKLFIYFFIVPEPCGAGASCIKVSAFGPAYWPWLATLPLVGGLAAVLARRQGARPAQRVMAALFPALYLAAETLVMGVIDGAFYWRIPVYWVAVPAIAAAAGTWPFLGKPRGPLRAQGVAAQ